MNPIDKLACEDKKLFQRYVSLYASHDGDYWSNIELDNPIYSIWNKNKASLFKLLGEELIIEQEVAYEQSAEELIDNLEAHADFMHYYSKLKNLLSKNLLLSCMRNNFYYDIQTSVLSLKNFAENVYTLPSREYVEEISGTSLKCHQGQKIMKIVHEIVKLLDTPEFSEQDYEAMRIAHSQCLNTKKLTGTLCLSIHPMDYATMSDNDCRWSSCMSWKEQGGYRRGTLEMLTSPYVVIAYLKADKDMNIEDMYFWNNKKWRELFVVTPDIIANIMGYPYHNEHLEAEIINILHELAIKNWGIAPLKGLYPYDGKNIKIDTEKSIPFIFKTNAMYNDFRDSHQVMISDKILKGEKLTLNYSGEGICLACGKPFDNDEEESCLLCYDCEEILYCDYCGDRIYGDNYYTPENSYICEDCYYNHFSVCSHCNEVKSNEQMTQFIFTSNNGDNEFEIAICNNCVQVFLDNTEKFVTHYEQIEDWFEVHYTIKLSDVLEEGKKFFDLSDNLFN